MTLNLILLSVEFYFKLQRNSRWDSLLFSLSLYIPRVYRKRGQKLSIRTYVKVIIRSNFISSKICIFVMLAFFRFETQKPYLRKNGSENKKVTYSDLQWPFAFTYIFSKSMKNNKTCSQNQKVTFNDIWGQTSYHEFFSFYCDSIHTKFW